MFLFSLSICFWSFGAKTFTSLQLSSQNPAPSFIEENAASQLIQDIENFTNIDFTFNNNTNKTNSYQFFLSSITIDDTTFKGLYSFGSGALPGCGGAIFIHKSTLYATNTFFEACRAVFGGALCVLQSIVTIQGSNSTFKSNKAYKTGGAIYYEGNVDNNGNNPNKEIILILQNTLFENNSALSGGAISANRAFDVYFENCKFNINTAKYYGGAIEFDRSINLNIFDSDFTSNNLSYNYQLFNNISHDYKRLTDVYSNKIRGGGAIYLRGDLNYNCSAHISNTCFSGNFVNHDNVTSYKGFGHDILIDANTFLFESEVIHQNNALTLYKAYFAHLILFNLKNGSQSCNPINLKLQSSTLLPMQPTVRSDNAQMSSVPEPTGFTYDATPITAFPKRTTAKFYPTSKMMTMNFKTIKNPLPPASTPPATPNFTPVPSIHPSQTKPSHDKDHTLSQSETISKVITLTNSTSYSESYVNGSLVYIPVVTQFFTYVETIVIVDVVIIDSKKAEISAAQLIYASTAGIGVFFLLAGVGLTLYRRVKAAKEEDSFTITTSESEETVDNNNPAGETRVSLDISVENPIVPELSDKSDEEFINTMDF